MEIEGENVSVRAAERLAEGNGSDDHAAANMDLPSPSISVAKEDAKGPVNEDRVENGRNNNNSVPFHKLFSFADARDILLMIVGFIGSVGNGICLPLTTVLFGSMIQSFGSNDNHEVLKAVSTVSLHFLFLAFGAGISSFLQVACWMTAGQRQAARLRSMYLKAILRQEVGFFDKDISTGVIVGQMSGDTFLIQDAMGEKVGKVIQLISSFIAGIAIAFKRGWLLSLVLMSMLPLLVLAGVAMTMAVSKAATLGQAAYAEASVVVEETIGSIRTVASFTGEKDSVKRYDKSLKVAYKSSVNEGLLTGLGLGSVMFVLFCGYSMATWYGSKLVIHKGYTGGAVINVLFSLLTGSFSLGQVSPCLTAFAAGQAVAFKIFETIARKPEIDSYDPSGKTLDDIRGDVEFRDVYFSYPTRPDDQIFKGFSLNVPSGMTMALVGESGSGKSTVISLIERFYDPHSGEVLIDGVNLKEFQLRWIRTKIGLVSQEPVLFASSIRENIAYGKDEATIEEIRVAAELANASKFIDKLPQGIDTMVGEHGTQLSGGQKQRVAIARAILKDPRILLLDEATSALDVESERVVQEALDRVMTNRTTLIVAHRLTTVRDADMIAVIHRGSIVEKGSHAELLKDTDGAYWNLIRLQEKNQAEEQNSASNLEKSEASPGISKRTSSQKLSLDHPTSQASSRGSSRHQSFIVPVGMSIEGDNQVNNTSEQQEAKVLSDDQKDVPMSRLFHLNKPEFPMLALGTFFAFVNGTVFPLVGLLLSAAVKTFYEPAPKLRKDSRTWSLLLVVAAVVTLLANPSKSYFFSVAGARLIKRIRLMTFEKAVNMEIGWFDDPENSSAAIGARLSTEASRIRAIVGDALALAIENSVTLICGLVIAFVANWRLALIVLGVVPFIGLSGYAQMKFIQGFSGDSKAIYEEATQVVADAVGSIRTLSSFSAEDKVIKLYNKKCEGPLRTEIKRGTFSGFGFGFSYFVLYSAYALSFYAGARLVQDGKATFGNVFRVIFVLAFAAVGVSQSSSLAPDSSNARSALALIFAIIDRKSQIDPSDGSGMTLESLNGDVEFRHVCFHYPMRKEIQIFQDLCLSIRSGKTVALVGESGSGKSTAISLLQRFYDPDSGYILVDGIEIHKFQLKWLRQQMGLVNQEPVLFNDTIRANISYGKEGQATESEILEAAELANAHNFISGLQQGYDTLVGERGIQLSGGQKQRVAIARAIVKQPKILLLDEATSALDAESERVVQEALDRVMQSRTTLVVAHRLSTIKNADVIAVVRNGSVVEKGKHDALIRIDGGAYAALVALHSQSTPPPSSSV